MRARRAAPRRLLLPFVGAAVLLGGCGDEPDIERSPEQLSRITNDSVRAIVSGTPESLATPDTAGVGEAESFNLVPIGGSGVSAEAIVAPFGDNTQVVIQIESVPAGTALHGSVRRGGCAGAGGEMVEPAEATQYAGDGARVARLLLPLAPAVVLGGGYSVRLGPAGDAASPPLACAEIPAGGVM